MTSLYSKKSVTRKRARRSCASKGAFLNSSRLTHHATAKPTLLNGSQGFIFTGNKDSLPSNPTAQTDVIQHIEDNSTPKQQTKNLSSTLHSTVTNMASMNGGMASMNLPNFSASSGDLINEHQSNSISPYSFYTPGKIPFPLATTNLQQNCPTQQQPPSPSPSLQPLCNLQTSQQFITNSSRPPYYFLSPNNELNSFSLNYLKQSCYSTIANAIDPRLSYPTDSSKVTATTPVINKAARKVLRHTRTGKRSLLSGHITNKTERSPHEVAHHTTTMKAAHKSCSEPSNDQLSTCNKSSSSEKSSSLDTTTTLSPLSQPSTTTTAAVPLTLDSATTSTIQTSTSSLHHRSKCKRGRLTDAQSSPSLGTSTDSSLPVNFLNHPYNPFSNPHNNMSPENFNLDLSTPNNSNLQDICKCFNCIEARKIREYEHLQKTVKQDGLFRASQDNVGLLRKGIQAMNENRDEITESELKKCISELVKQDAHSLLASLEPLCQVRVRLANSRIQAQLREGIDSPELARQFVDVVLEQYQRLKDDADQQAKILEDLESGYLAKQGLSWKLICQYRFYKEVFQLGNLRKLLEGDFLEQLKPNHQDSNNDDSGFSYLNKYLALDSEMQEINRLWKELQVESDEWSVPDCENSFDLLGGELSSYRDLDCDILLQTYLNNMLNTSPAYLPHATPNLPHNLHTSDICTICDSPAGFHYHARTAHLQPPSLSPSGDSSDSSGEVSSSTTSSYSSDGGYDAEEETELTTTKSDVNESPNMLPPGDSNPYSQMPGPNSLLYGSHPSVWMPQPLLPNSNWSCRLPNSPHSPSLFSPSGGGSTPNHHPFFQSNYASPLQPNASPLKGNLFSTELQGKQRVPFLGSSRPSPASSLPLDSSGMANSTSIAVQASVDNLPQKRKNISCTSGHSNSRIGGASSVDPIEDDDVGSLESSTEKDNLANNNNKLCDCCQCEMFGHGAGGLPPTVKRSYEERRQQLLEKLAKRKERKKCGKACGSGQQQFDAQNEASRPSPMADVEELLSFINGDDSGQSAASKSHHDSTNLKKNSKKEKKKAKQQRRLQKSSDSPLEKKEENCESSVSQEKEEEQSEPQEEKCDFEPLQEDVIEESESSSVAAKPEKVILTKSSPVTDNQPIRCNGSVEPSVKPPSTKRGSIELTVSPQIHKPSRPLLHNTATVKTKTFTNRSSSHYYPRHSVSSVINNNHQSRANRANNGSPNFPGSLVGGHYYRGSQPAPPPLISTFAPTNGRIVFNSAVTASLDNNRSSYKSKLPRSNPNRSTHSNIKPLIPQSFMFLPKQSNVPYNGGGRTTNCAPVTKPPVMNYSNDSCKTKAAASSLASGVMTTRVNNNHNDSSAPLPVKPKLSIGSSGECDFADIFTPHSPESNKSLEMDYDPIVEEFKRILINTDVPTDRIKLDEGLINMDQFVKHSKKK